MRNRIDAVSYGVDVQRTWIIQQNEADELRLF